MTYMRITIQEDDDEIEHTIPAVWEICLECNGNGHHSKHIGALTQEDIARDWSPDEFEDYLAGAYDRECNTCNGSGKVKFPLNPGKEPARTWLRQEEERASERRADLRTLYMESGGSMGQW